MQWEDVATIHRGVIDGAVFVVGVPKATEDGPAWNQCLLLHAHGFRAADAPLVADLDDKFWLRLIQLGWAVGVTSYRRSGKIVQEAVKVRSPPLGAERFGSRLTLSTCRI